MKIINNNVKIFKISLLVVGIGILLSFGVNTCAADSSSGIYVNGSSGNDNWDGLNSTFTSGLNGPKATIQNATGTVTSGGTVHIASGTYNENNIQITTNMTIIGENQANTIIDAQGQSNIFNIATGINLTLINITLQNGYNDSGGAIINDGTLTVINSTFNNNTAATRWGSGSVGGGAILNDGTLTVINSTFNNNTAITGCGGAIYNTGTLTETDDAFNNNTSQSSCGGAIYNAGTLTGTKTTFNNNTANAGGGAIYNTGTLTETKTTFNNNTATKRQGGAIYNEGTLTETDDAFNNNTAESDNAGAIYNTGTLTGTNTTFNNNTADTYGGAIYTAGTLTATNITFNNNSANYGGGAIFNTGTLNVINDTFNNNTGTDYGTGGAIENFGTLTINNSTFTNNTATNNGGAIESPGTLTINNSTFTNNAATNNGGAIHGNGIFDVEGNSFVNNRADVGSAFYFESSKKGFSYNVHFNRIIGNTNSIELYYAGNGKVNATLNWWGSNNPENLIYGTNVIYNPWIILIVTTSPKTINASDKSTVTADLLHDNEGNYLDPVYGHVPDGIPVNFRSDELGTLIPTTSTTTNESANTTFTGHSGGVSEVSATVDNQIIYTNITISEIPSAYLYLHITSANKNPKVNETFTLTYKLGNNGPDNATNVVTTIPLPSDFTLSNITGDGNWTYNNTTNTITWTLTNVTVGDPYLYLTGKISKSGLNVFGSNISSETYNLNIQGVTPITITPTDPITPINPINPINPITPTTSTTKTILNTDTTSIPMQHTGLPIAGLILSILTVIGGTIIPRIKK